MESLKICTQKTLSMSDEDVIVESFGMPSIDGILPGAYDSEDIIISEGFRDIYIWNESNTNRLRELNGKKNIVQLSHIFETSKEIVRDRLNQLGLQIIENFEDIEEEDGTSVLFKRLKGYFDDGVLVKTDPTLNIIDTILERKFIAKKITISFAKLPEEVVWTPMSKMENTRGANGEAIKPDPIEYEIREMTPMEAFKKVVSERIEPFVNIKFEYIEYVDKEFDLLSAGVVRVGFTPATGAWSLMGINNYLSTDETTMNIGWIDAATIMHEMGHVLGMIHEHQVPYGSPIEWNEDAVYEWAKEVQGWTKEEAYVNIIKQYDHSLINGTDYNPESIMLYFFPAELTLNGVGSSQNLRLSVNDAKFIRSLMPGKKIDMKKFFKDNYDLDITDRISIWWYVLVVILIILIIIVFSISVYKLK